jgi:hypothetical protein
MFVPEATINKNRDFPASKDDVWAAGKLSRLKPVVKTKAA